MSDSEMLVDDPEGMESEVGSRPKCSAPVSQTQLIPAAQDNKALIWKHFKKVPLDPQKSKCDYCGVTIKVLTGSTTSMHRHLLNKHKKIYELFKKEQEEKKVRKISCSETKELKPKIQQTISQAFGNMEKWPSTHPKAVALTNKLGVWVAKNMHPYSIVDEKEFIDLMNEAQPKYAIPSRTTLSRRVIPTMYDSKKLSIQKEIQLDLESGIHSLGYTTDLWTSRSNDPYISLTLHYMSNELDLKRFCLGNEYNPGEHTGVCLADKLRGMVEEWGLSNATVPTIYAVTDNATNITSAVRHLNWSHIPCFAHTLQLALGDAKKATSGMVSMLSKARSIVGHYKRSSSAQKRLHDYQTNLGKKPLELLQDCETRWNSEFNMLIRLVQQKEAISGELIASSSSIDNLSNSEWSLAEEYIDILKPLDEATTRASGNLYATLPMVYPLVSTLENGLQKRIADRKPGIVFARNLFRCLKTRFAYIKNDNLYKKAMALDPHFKCVILPKHEKEFIIEQLTTEALGIHSPAAQATPDDNLLSQPSTSSGGLAKSDQSQHTVDFWDSFEELAAKTETSTASDSDVQLNEANKLRCKTEIENFLDEKRLPYSENTILWWKNNAYKYVYMVPLVKHYLSIPATEVDSERVFSAAGNIVTTKRERLTQDHVKELVFLHENL